jgi:hypothetical protein
LAAVASSNRLGSFGVSSYNALSVSFTRRFSSGLQFKANYTFAKKEDDTDGHTADEGAGGPQSFWLTKQTGIGVAGFNQTINSFSAGSTSCRSEKKAVLE